MAQAEPLLVMEGITKTFPGVLALQGASLRVGRGTVHALVGQNGSPVDPLRIRLPRGRALEGDFLTAFEQERERSDTLLGNAPAAAQKVASAAALTE